MVDLPRALLAGLLLCASCSLMICAWYLHLNYTNRWSLSKAIIISWLIAGGEYCLQVPANRIGAQAGLSAASLRGIAEFFILASFIMFSTKVLQQPLLWNHVIGFATVLAGVLIVLGGPFQAAVYADNASSKAETHTLVAAAESPSLPPHSSPSPPPSPHPPLPPPSPPSPPPPPPPSAPLPPPSPSPPPPSPPPPPPSTSPAPPPTPAPPVVPLTSPTRRGSPS